MPIKAEIITKDRRIEEIEKIEKYVDLSSVSSRVGINQASPKEPFVKIY